MQKTQTAVKPAKAAAKPATAKAAAKPAATIIARLVNPAIASFFTAASKAHHKGRYTVSSTGDIAVTADGRKFFGNRLSGKPHAQFVADAKARMQANADAKADDKSSRAWIANAAIMNGKPVALPLMTGAGDTMQQAVFAIVIAAATAMPD
jgi:hypothetical protein